MELLLLTLLTFQIISHFILNDRVNVFYFIFKRFLRKCRKCNSFQFWELESTCPKLFGTIRLGGGGKHNCIFIHVCSIYQGRSEYSTIYLEVVKLVILKRTWRKMCTVRLYLLQLKVYYSWWNYDQNIWGGSLSRTRHWFHSAKTYTQTSRIVSSFF